MRTLLLLASGISWGVGQQHGFPRLAESLCYESHIMYFKYTAVAFMTCHDASHSEMGTVRLFKKMSKVPFYIQISSTDISTLKPSALLHHEFLVREIWIFVRRILLPCLSNLSLCSSSTRHGWCSFAVVVQHTSGCQAHFQMLLLNGNSHTPAPCKSFTMRGVVNTDSNPEYKCINWLLCSCYVLAVNEYLSLNFQNTAAKWKLWCCEWMKSPVFIAVHILSTSLFVDRLMFLCIWNTGSQTPMSNLVPHLRDRLHVDASKHVCLQRLE